MEDISSGRNLVSQTKGAGVNARQILRRAPGPAIATDENGCVVAWNRAASELLAFESRAATEGKRIHDLLRTRDVFGNRLPDTSAPLLAMALRGEPVNAFEVKARKISGEPIRLSISVVAVLGAGSGQQDELVYLLRPVSRDSRIDGLLKLVLADLGDDRRVSVGGARPNKETDQARQPTLTRRQSQVLRLLANGHDTREIAKALGVSVNTVRSHTQALLRSLGVHSKLEAVAAAFRDRLI